MCKRIFTGISLLVFVSLFFSCKSEKQELPNIVLIFVDDLGYADIGCFGATDYTTPNIDRLASEGARFTSFYASQAVCSASRSSLLTGCYSERVGIRGALGPKSNIGINADETLIPEMLKEKGYATGIFGKWHLGHLREFMPLQHGFDEYVGLPYSNDMWPVGYDGVSYVGTDHGKSTYPPLTLFDGNEVVDTIATLDDQAELTTLYTQKATQFIEDHKSEPFFLYMPHSMVHVPIAVSEKFKNKSGKGLFADVMMELDWSVGEIIKALEQNGLSDNTLIIFTADNGPWLNYGKHAGSALPLREGKGTMWEGGPRVSTAMRWTDKIPAGLVCDNIASTIDILPTLSEITGASLPTNKIDGLSILPLMLGEEGANPRNQFYYYYSGELIAVRKDNWKLVFPHNFRSYEGVEPGKDGFPGPYGKGRTNQMELYNLADDISETNNVIAQYPEIVKELNIIADTARNELGDRMNNKKGKGVRKPGRRRVEKKSIENLAINKPISIKNKYSFDYSGSGDKTLVNGVSGSLDFTDLEWLGFEGVDFEATIDMEKVTPLKKVVCRFLLNQTSWIFLPGELEISISDDNKNFNTIFLKSYENEKEDLKVDIRQIGLNTDVKTRYIKIKAQAIGTLPEWHPGYDDKGWLFVDEIIIR